MLPFRLKPVFKNYIWGGTELIEKWGKTPDSNTLAESWELASHPDGDNIIIDGKFSGLTLSEAVKIHPEMVSPVFKNNDIFPLMVKLINSKNPLSIQVHPSDEYAMKFENSKGKVEAWYILGHDDGAFIYLGFQENISRGEFENAVKNGTLTGILKKINVNDGDIFFIPSGTVHAIGAGITLAEIQENSNITYRVYDYGRLGADGKPRELHISKALDVADTSPVNLNPPGKSGNVIVNCNSFKTEKLKAPFIGNTENKGFRFILCIDGDCSIKCDDFQCILKKGNNVFIPSDCKSDYLVEGKGDFLISCACL